MMCIYKITSPTGRVYIGQTVNVLTRRSYYKNLQCKRQRRIFNSLKKHGWERHRFEIIHELPEDCDKEVLMKYEELYIEQYKECGVELMNLKGGGRFGKLSQESKDLIGAVHRGLKMKPHLVEELRQRMRGKKFALGYRFSEESLKNRIKYMGGGKHPSAVKVLNVKTGELYDCVKAASEKIGINYFTLYNQLSGHRSNRTDLKFYRDNA